MRLLDDKEMTISTKRTLKSLRQALTDLLKIKPIDKISIQELCDLAMISRGTFYNYFYDKYDLLNYDWAQVQLLIDPKFTHPDLNTKHYKKYIQLFLNNLINHLAKEYETYQLIMVNNSDNIFTLNMHEYMMEQILLRLQEATDKKEPIEVPLELLATVYASTIITVSKWWLKSGKTYSKQEVYNFFTIIIERNLVLSSDCK